MFNTQNDALPACSDLQVDSHVYLVTISTTDGVKVYEALVKAGSAAHAAAMAGMLLLEKLRPNFGPIADPAGLNLATFNHNMADHTVVNVQLIG